MRVYLWRVGRVVLLVSFVLAAGGVSAFVAMRTPASGQAQAATVLPAEPAEGIRREGKAGAVVPERLRANMNLRTAIAAVRTRPIPLAPFQGSLALDTERLARVHTRFAGELAEFATRADPVEPSFSAEPSRARPLRAGDAVRKGDLLAVVWSKDLGEKKSELVDGLSKLKADERQLTRLQELLKVGGTAERSLRDAERAVESDRVAVRKVESTLRSVRLSEEEIAVVRAEAEGLSDGSAKRNDPAAWARVEIRSPIDGVVLEKNALSVGQWVDPSAPLYQIGDLSHLAVWVHVFEEDLPLLQSLPRPVRWTVQLPSRPGVKFPGRLEQIGAVIDPTQHTALAIGHVENPKGDLKAGQYVTVSVELPPPSGEIELPADAVVEDGRESVVFVQSAGSKDRFVCTPVRVTSRFRDVVCIRSNSGVAAGDHVVTGGALLLRGAMDQLAVPQP